MNRKKRYFFTGRERGTLLHMKYSEEQKSEARRRYFAGEKVVAIAGALNIERRTLYAWIKAGGWPAAAGRDDPLAVIERRMAELYIREGKTILELFELDRLEIHYEKLKRLDAQLSGRRTAPENAAEDGAGQPPKGRKRGRKPQKNDFTDIDEADLLAKFKDGLFDYQLDCWEHLDESIRYILKSRQIGMTWYFAREAFVNALLTGDNQIFISASRAQAGVFREYIRMFARDGYNVELKGQDTIELHTPHGVATLYFLSTNSNTAQSYHGHLYIDEFFWIPNFARLKGVAFGMGSQAKWRITMFSTPSVKSHQAYPYWTGDDYNEQNKRENKPVEIFPERDALRDGGRVGPDGVWRRIITLDDAEANGCNLFNRKKLAKMFSPDEFKMLFDCWFIDDTAGVFSYAQLEKCLGDLADYPDGIAKRRVWIGYDPSRSRDGASIVVVAPPSSYKGKFYVLEKITRYGVSWEEQAAIIKELCRKYDVEYIGIDVTGPGSGVVELVQRFFPAADGIFYTLEKKTKLVLKAQQLIGDHRIKWDASWSDIAAGFLQIKRGSSLNGQITYFAERNSKTGHADSAWAIMHALSHEDLILPDEEDKNYFVV